MPLPDLTHLQFEVLDILGGVARPGWVIRDKLAEKGEKKTLPAFYQMMSRLEDSEFVKGEYRKAEVEGHPVNERWYKITGHGLKARQAALDFYRDRELARAKGGLAHE
jgi:DNA-binding PadR family transcriptional regulator